MPNGAQAAAYAESHRGERSRAITRVLVALQELSSAPHRLSNHDLALRLGVPSASMYRLLQKLADAACRATPLRRLLDALRAEAGDQIAIWVRSR